MAFTSNVTWVVIPAFNEQTHIASVVSEVLKYTPHLVVVDDGSQPSLEFLKDRFPSMVYLRHDVNLGKGAAMKTGCDLAVKRGAKYLVVMDADGQHKAVDIPRFVEKLDTGKYDIVFGARIIGKNMPLVLFLGNKFLSICVNLLFRMFLSDTQGGFRAFTASAFRELRWDSSDYTVETEMVIQAAKRHLRYTEVAIQTIYHDKYKGTTPMDGIKIFVQILKWRVF